MSQIQDLRIMGRGTMAGGLSTSLCMCSVVSCYDWVEQEGGNHLISYMCRILFYLHLLNQQQNATNITNISCIMMVRQASVLQKCSLAPE